MSWVDYYIDLALHAATKSKDPRAQVGCAIADRHNATVSTGINGFPIGVAEGGHWHTDIKYLRVIHAEINALIFADPRRLAGATLTVTKAPCAACAAVICQHHALYGPIRVVCPPVVADSKWAESQLEAMAMFAEVGIEVEFREFQR